MRLFTGLIEAVGRVESMAPNAGGVRLEVDAGELDVSEVAVGESVAVNGCCLTVVASRAGVLAMDLSPETLACTTLGTLGLGARVNLERALRASGRLGGHILSGHVDGVAEVLERREQGGTVELSVRVPEGLSRYICRKGAVAIDGISLTVNRVSGVELAVQLIPHTLEATIAGGYERGVRVNIEVDLIARYLERLIAAHAAPP